MRIIFLEGTRYDEKASKQLADSGLFTQEEADEIINELFTKKKIHAFINSKSWLEKYLKGIVRMIIDEADGDKDKAYQFINDNKTLETFDKYLTYVKDNRDKQGNEKDKTNFDNQFIDRMSFNDVEDFVEKYQDELDKQSEDELKKMKFGSSSYELIPIDSYEEMHEKFGGRLTGDGSSDKYAGGGGTAWCHTNSENTYNSWINRDSGGNTFFILMNKNFKDIPFNPETNKEMEGKDDYGNSLIALLVDRYGRLKNATLRCNHVGVEYNADNQYKTYAELSKVAGFNVEKKIQELGNFEESPIKDGVFIYKGGDVDWDIKKEIVKVIVADGVKQIEAQAFYGCESLTNIEIPDSVTYIGDGAFRDCYKLKSIKIPEGVSIIGSHTFEDCGELVDVKLPSRLQEIHSYAFSTCNIKSITIPNNVNWIGNSAFSYSAIESIILPSKLISIESNTFSYCDDLKSIVIPNNVTKIDIRAFFGCDNLESVTIPNSVTWIGESSFRVCPKLESVEIPNPLCRVDESAFDNNTEVTVSPHSILYRDRNKVDFTVIASTDFVDADLVDYLNEAIRSYCSDTDHHKLLQNTLGRDDFEDYLDSSYYKDVYKYIKDITENPETAGELNIDFSVDVNDMSEDTKFFIDEIFAKQFFRAYLDELKSDLFTNVSSYVSDSQKVNDIKQYFRNLSYRTDLFDFMVQMGIIDEEVEVDTEDYYKLIQNKLRKDHLL